MAIMIGNLNNPIEVSNTICNLYNKDMQSSINDVVMKFFNNIKELYLNNFGEFIKQFSIVLSSIVKLNDPNLCINIINHITDINLKYKILEFFSYKWLEFIFDKLDDKLTSEQINFINLCFQQLKIVDVIKIIKFFNFDNKEEFICIIFKDTLKIKSDKFFLESIKQSYTHLARELIKSFPEIIDHSEEMFIDLLAFEGSIFNKSILFFCNTIKHFLQKNWLHNLNKINNSKNIGMTVEIIKWIINNINSSHKSLIHYEILIHSIVNDNQYIFNHILSYFSHLNKFRILNIIVNSISNNNSIVLHNYLLENVFYNDEIDSIFEYAKKKNYKYLLDMLYIHYSYKIYCINQEYYMMDIDVIYKSINMILFKNMKYEYTETYNECFICYNTHSRIIKLSCHETHLFCEDCLSRWMITQSSCPLCRLNIDINRTNLLFVTN